MSTSRRETAAARAALARRRQRGIFTPSPTTNALMPQPAISSQDRPKSLPIKVTSKQDVTPPLSTPAASVPTVTTKSRSRGPSQHVRESWSAQKVNDRPRAASAPSPSPQRAASRSTLSFDSKVSGHGALPTKSMSDRNVRFTTNDTNVVITMNEPDEDEQVIEEPEPIVANQVVDAKCLFYGSTIVLRSQSSAHALVSVTKKTRGDAARYLATMNHLGGIQDVFQVTKEANDDLLCYGDTIALRSKAAQDRTLGVRKMSATEGSTTYEIGFFRSTVSPAEQWTILRGGRIVLVGSAALTNNNVAKQGKTAAVRSGDAIVLRNEMTGGLLALDSLDDDTLTLVTDSYDSDAIRTGCASDKDPLSKIQHHDRILPTSRETFQFVNSHVPPCPQWVDDGNRRMYEDGSYLLHSGRNDRTEETRLQLFGPAARDGRKSLQTPLKCGVSTQERLLLDEVIGSLIGLEGHYIEFSTSELCFQLADPPGVSFDTSLRNLVNRILPLSTAFVRVRAFLSEHRPGYEYGLVVQAVCEALDGLLQDYLVFVAEMEQLLRQDEEPDAMTMSKLNVYVQSPLRKMAVMEHVTATLQEHKGGSLLNALHQLKTRVFAGDDIAQQVLETLLQKGSVPYFEMLDAWLQAGVIDDPYNEFMIEANVSPNTTAGYDGDTWNEMFRIRTEHVLEYVLSSPVVQQQILFTGKYWNAVQLCHRTTADLEDIEPQQDQQDASHVQYGMDAVAISKYVHSMHRRSSQRLLQLLMGDFDAMETLLTLKRYFLLHQGDFVVHLFDAAEDELSKEMQDISRGRVNQWLSMCIHLTEPENEDSTLALTLAGASKPAGPLTVQMIKCSFAPDSLMDHLVALHAESGGIDVHEPKTPSRCAYGMSDTGMTGIEGFSIHFDRIPFPTSLLISQRALSTYQLLFRHLLFAKHVERRLVGVWLDHQMMKQFQSLRSAMGPTYCLRQRMLHFMQNFIYYMMFEVIEPNWLEMENAIRVQQSTGNGAYQGIHTVDDLIRVHNRFLDLALAECLLTNRELVRTLTKLMRTCLLFSEQLKRFMEATKIVDENVAVAKEKRSTIQRNLNDPSNTRRAPSKKALRKAMLSQNEERSLRMQKQASRVERELANESYARMISRFDEVFSENLADFMKQLLSASNEEHHSQKANLCIRLDYNGYVTKQMGLH